MKKTLVSALTTAIVVGAASTTFAAANPFEDVPADHWAYDAIAQLAADGVIEGYGDGTYRGDQEITRYEMAQMIARAMAKGGGDKALIDKLAAEFADELNNLGVRVAALEKKVDNVRWKGWVGYEFVRDIHKYDTPNFTLDTNNWQRLQFQLNPTMTINKNWTARARIKYYSDMDSAENTTGNTVRQAHGNGVRIDRMWAIGNYGKLKIELGKVPYEGRLDKGLVLGNRISGGVVTFGNVLKTSIGLGRYNHSPNRDVYNANWTTNLGFVEMDWQASKKLNIGLAYYRENDTSDSTWRWNAGIDTRSQALEMAKADARAQTGEPEFGADHRNIFEIGVNYKLSPVWDFNAAYAKNTTGNWSTKYNQAYSIEFAYNGGRYPAMKPGNFGAFVAYRHLGRGAVLGPTYDEVYYVYDGTQKGWNVGAAYVFDKNIMGTVLWFGGKDVGYSGDKDFSTLYTALQFFF